MFTAADATTLEHPLADLVNRETGGGERLVRFLSTLMEGGIDDAKPYLRLRAARELSRITNDEDAREFLKTYKRRFLERSVRNGSAPDVASAEPSAEQDPESAGPGLSLPDLVQQETGDGRSAVRFLVDVMEGRREGYKPHHRLRAAEELLHHGFDVPFMANLAIARLANRMAHAGPPDRHVTPDTNGAAATTTSEPAPSVPEDGAPPHIDCHCPDGDDCFVVDLDPDEIEDLGEELNADPGDPLCCCLHWKDGTPCEYYPSRGPP